MPEVIETGFGDGHPPPEFKSGKKKRGFSVKRTKDALFDDDAGRATADFFVFLSSMPFRRICRHVTASEITKWSLRYEQNLTSARVKTHFIL